MCVTESVVRCSVTASAVNRWMRSFSFTAPARTLSTLSAQTTSIGASVVHTAPSTDKVTDFTTAYSDVLTLLPPIPLRLYTLPYWSNPPFLISDIRTLWHSGLIARAPECQKLKMVGWTSIVLVPSSSSSLEQLASLKGLNTFVFSWVQWCSLLERDITSAAK